MLSGLMNDTKWEELRVAMYELGRQHPLFQMKVLNRDEPYFWDGDWFYHFRLLDYKEIEWVDLRVKSNEQREVVRERLAKIHVPGIATQEGFRIFGWVEPSVHVQYIE